MRRAWRPRRRERRTPDASSPPRGRSDRGRDARARPGAVGPSATKRTSTVVTSAGSYFHWRDLPGERGAAPGGSQAARSRSTSVPSSWRVYQRPPSRGSIDDLLDRRRADGCALGHQPVMPAVKTSKALSRGRRARRRTARTTGRSGSLLFPSSSSRVRPRTPPATAPRTGPARCAGRPGPAGRPGRAAACPPPVDDQPDVLEHLQVLGDRGRLTGSSAASSPTGRGPSARRSKIACRVGSPSAVIISAPFAMANRKLLLTVLIRQVR